MTGYTDLLFYFHVGGGGDLMNMDGKDAFNNAGWFHFFLSFSSDLFFSRTERNSIIIYAVLLSSWSETCILELQFGC